VALVPQWRQDYPNNLPPTRVTAISAMGQNAVVIAMQQFLVSRSLDDLAGDGEQTGR
jgi:hypothetical protein